MAGGERLAWNLKKMLRKEGFNNGWGGNQDNSPLSAAVVCIFHLQFSTHPWYLFIHLASIYLSIYYGPGHMPSTGDTKVSKSKNDLTPTEPGVRWETWPLCKASHVLMYNCSCG